MTVTFEDRQALAARAELLGVLRDELGATVTELARRPRAAVRRRCGISSATCSSPIRARSLPTGRCSLLEGAGERGEAELIGRKIARLLADGVDPDEIAIAVRSPDRQAPLIARDPRAPRHSAGARGERAAGDDGDRLQPVRAARDRRRRGRRRRRSSRCFAARPGPAASRSTGSSGGAPRERMQTRRGGARRMGAATARSPRRIWALDDLREAGDDRGGDRRRR